ncbi:MULTISPECIES: autotransporter domain-containing protein [Rhodanobacter]|uniref:autotransporter domain-containing protein n=1 Tax=Rhodanobacter TaxID=75309 RepID=UPI0009DB7977
MDGIGVGRPSFARLGANGLAAVLELLRRSGGARRRGAPKKDDGAILPMHACITPSRAYCPPLHPHPSPHDRDECIRTDPSASRGHIRSYQATAYPGYAPGLWFANAALVYGLDDYSSSRRVAFPGIDETARADYRGHRYTEFGATGYHFYVGDGRSVITPTATVQYTRMKMPGYREFGGNSVNLAVDAQTYRFLQSGLGVKFSRDLATSGDLTVRPEMHANCCIRSAAAA